MRQTHLFEPHTKSLSSSSSSSSISPSTRALVPGFVLLEAAAVTPGNDASLWMDDPPTNFWPAIVAAATAARDVATTAPLVRAYEALRGPERCETHRRPLSACVVCLLNMCRSGDVQFKISCRVSRAVQLRELTAFKITGMAMRMLQTDEIKDYYGWVTDFGSFHSTCSTK
jgi:hypothetical protein